MYKFRVEERIKESLVWVWAAMDVSPTYGNDTKVSIRKASNEKYCRYSFDGTFIFTGKDYDVFEDIGLESLFRLTIVYDNGSTKRDIVQAEFTVADMEFDRDNKSAILHLRGKDQYEEFLDKCDVEYDLVQLAPPKRNVQLYKRAFLQFYVQGDTKLTNVIDHTSYEVDATEDAPKMGWDALINMHFGIYPKVERTWVLEVQDTFSADYGQLQGTYTTQAFDAHNDEIWREDRAYKWVIQDWYDTASWGKLENADGTPVFVDRTVLFGLKEIPANGKVPVKVHWHDSGLEQTIGYLDMTNRAVFSRIVSDNPTDTNKRPGNDIWQGNANFRYARSAVFGEQDINDKIIFSRELTNTPNQWKQNGEERYFVQPKPTTSSEVVIPIGWNQWIPMSIWFRSNTDIARELAVYNQPWVLHDAYRLTDAINVLLGRMDIGITLESDFLNNVNVSQSEASNPIMGIPMWFFLTPITNIKKTHYEVAAQKGRISLRQILDMLKKTLNCYWFLQQKKVGGEWKWVLRIEHVKWFDKGGDYRYDTDTYRNFTGERVNLSYKGWMTAQDQYRYKMDDVRSRISFQWGDKCSDIFNGYPLNFRDYFAQKTSAENVSIDNFVADIDFVEMSPEVVSNDTFALIVADRKDKSPTSGFLPRVYVEEVGYFSNMDKHPRYLLQNAYLSFYYLEQAFLDYNLPVINPRSAVMDTIEEPVLVESTMRIVRQRVTTPFELDRPDICEEKVKTGLGSDSNRGEIESIEFDIDSHTAQIEVNYRYKV